MMEKIRNYILIAGLISLILMVGIVIGENHRGKGTFFRSWMHNELYYGEKIKVKSGRTYTNFYNNNCRELVVVGLQDAKEDNLAWVMAHCSFGGSENEYFLTFSQDELEAK